MLGDAPLAAKLVLLGDMGAGKSSLVLRFVKGQFHDYQVNTTWKEACVCVCVCGGWGLRGGGRRMVGMGRAPCWVETLAPAPPPSSPPPPGTRELRAGRARAGRDGGVNDRERARAPSQNNALACPLTFLAARWTTRARAARGTAGQR